MSKVKRFKCALCGKKVKERKNSAYPVSEGSCCYKCNISIVVTERLKALNDFGTKIYSERKMQDIMSGKNNDSINDILADELITFETDCVGGN